MCEPTTLLAISLAISTAGTAASLEGQRYQASTQATHQRELTKANNASAAEQMSQLRIQEAQSTESRARETEKARLASQKAVSTATVAAGEAGVGGNSVDALLQEYGMQFGQFKEASARQAAFNKSATDAQVAATSLGGNYQNKSINAPIVGPNYLAEGLRLGGDYLRSYNAFRPNDPYAGDPYAKRYAKTGGGPV